MKFQIKDDLMHGIVQHGLRTGVVYDFQKTSKREHDFRYIVKSASMLGEHISISINGLIPADEEAAQAYADYHKFLLDDEAFVNENYREDDTKINPVIIGKMISAFRDCNTGEGEGYAQQIADKYRENDNERAARIIEKRLGAK